MIKGRGDAPAAELRELDFTSERVTPAERFSRFGHAAAAIEVPTDENAELLERELFERGCLVTVLTSAEQIVLDAFLNAGAIAIYVKAGAPAVSVEDLEQRGLIRAAQDPFTGGGGI
jgi:hypothetical protein